MKELTIEQKAKAYDAALERAEKALEVFGTDKCEGARQIFSLFPELKESEDERIMKDIKRAISVAIDYSYFDKKTANNCFSWLEKQGEQKHFDYENANIQQKDFAPQKDIPRYSIGDVLCDKSCTMLNKESQSNFEITDIRNGMYICDKCSFPISQQDEYELVAKRIEQKPADLEEFISELSKQFPDVSFAKLSRIAVRVAKWANKPCWSEENKKHIIDIIDYLDDYYSFAKDEYEDVADGVQNEIRWLQSI